MKWISQPSKEVMFGRSLDELCQLHLRLRFNEPLLRRGVRVLLEPGPGQNSNGVLAIRFLRFFSFQLV